MTPRTFLPAFVVATLWLTGCGSSQSAAAGRPLPTTHTVTIANMRFEPETLVVNAGDTVVWINKDLVPHTVTLETGGLNSSGIDAGKSWQFVAGPKGSFAYVCSFHPTMKATLRIK